ncbi:MAG: M6 family metalloprotease domain-containing protein [Euryarchaeota archaeon]|nr:M6 family metalloprotease domain-containing protein [Euryarchaeota archaeon]
MQRLLTLLAALAFISVGGWSFLNQEIVDTWILERNFIETHDTDDLVGLQTNETWLVLIVDFESNPSNGVWGADEARSLLANRASDYFYQVSGNLTNVNLTVYPEVIRASNDLTYYGGDTSNRDVDADGTFMPEELAQEAVEGISTPVDWDPFDLDGDGTIDRLLILHTSKGQEENPGVKNRIWSHFTHFDSPINVAEGHTVEHYTMASLQTGTSGIGTIMHEMMHQMGAVDLYPVHDDSSFQTWKGLGDWDVMASGNWNGGGLWPALPSGGILDMIGANRTVELDLTWPSDSVSPCIGPTISLDGTSDSGDVLKVPIGEDESIYIERRSDSGYDTRLPGSGILVTYSDSSAGNIDRNEVNTNPNFPFLMVIEADGQQDLVSGSNEGEQSDLFSNGSNFGAEGIQIRTHDGVLVGWTASISGDDSQNITFRSTNCSPSFELDLPDYSATLLPNATIPVDLNHPGPCTSNLTSSDGRGISIVQNSLDSNEFYLQFTQGGMANSLTIVEGNIQCDNDGSYHIIYPVLTLNRIPIEASFKADISSVEPSIISVPIASLGENIQRISVEIEGPLSRIAEADDFVLLSTNGSYELNIQPNGLLSDNMLVRGELILSTEEGGEWVILVELSASDEDDMLLSEWRTPGRVLGIAGMLIGIYLVLGLRQNKPPRESKDDQPKPTNQIEQEEIPSDNVDPWGRPVDRMNDSYTD